MTITEKAAYIKGLIEGLALEPDKKETKVLNAMADLLKEIADEVADTQADVASLGDEIDDIDEDLAALEDEVYDLQDDEDDDDEDDEDEDDDFFEVSCPDCGEKVYVDGGILEEGSLECPGCGKKLSFIPDCSCCDGNCAECEEEDDEK